MSSLPNTALVVGTRGSKLALTQTEQVCSLLREMAVAPIQLTVIESTGDRSQESLSQIGGQGVFTAELEHALLDRRIDLAVHSLKDLPTANPVGLDLIATPARADVRDVLVTAANHSLYELRQGAILGTGSARRRTQLLALRPDLRFADIRGNVDTRIRKVESENLDGVVLAAAGLQRLSLLDHISTYLDTDELLPAPGQGALALQMRTDDPRREWVSEINHPATWAGTVAERRFLHGLGGGCRTPIGAWGRNISGELLLDGFVASGDGSDIRRRSSVGNPDKAAKVGAAMATDLLHSGAADLLTSETQDS